MNYFNVTPRELILQIANLLPDKSLFHFIRTCAKVNKICSEIMNQRRKIHFRVGSKLLNADSIFEYIFDSKNRKSNGKIEYNVLYEYSPFTFKEGYRKVNGEHIRIMEILFENEEQQKKFIALYNRSETQRSLDWSIQNCRLTFIWDKEGKWKDFYNPGITVKYIKAYLKRKLDEGCSFYTDLKYSSQKGEKKLRTYVTEYKFPTSEYKDGEILSLEGLIFEDSTVEGSKESYIHFIN